MSDNQLFKKDPVPRSWWYPFSLSVTTPR